MTNLEGRRALVTGASRGIGAAIALELAERGADVVISYERAGDRAAEIVSQIERKGRRAFAVKANGADPAAVRALINETVAKLGGLDILVNNAGTARMGSITELTLEEIDLLLHVNIRGTVLTTQAAIPHMADGGRILVIGSNTAERVPDPVLTTYAMTKAAHHGLVKGVARDLGPQGITVNLIQPGPTDTELNPSDGESGDLNRSLVALGRYARVEEIAAVAAFLASPAASYVTGSVVTVDGGFNA